VVSLAELTAKFRSVWPFLNERTRRLMAASEAKAVGHGGVTLLHRACGLSRKAILKGIRELEAGIPCAWRIPNSLAFLGFRRAMYTDILHFLARVLVIQGGKGLLTGSESDGFGFAHLLARRAVPGSSGFAARPTGPAPVVGTAVSTAWSLGRVDSRACLPWALSS
jgi:hypothetical protein